jgi:hypothetical protein
MCRSIKTLRRADDPATEDEIRAAALQFVRKVSGYRVPAARNAEAFDSAVDEITAASQRLLDGLVPVGTQRAGGDAMAAHARAHAAGREHAHVNG